MPSSTNQTKSIVSLERCTTYDADAVAEATARLIEPFGGMAAFVRPGDSVLLKPNLIVPRPAEAAVTTHPEVVRAVARMVIEAGAKPFIGDSPAFSSAKGVARACGMARMADEIGIDVVDLGRKSKRTRLDDPGSNRAQPDHARPHGRFRSLALASAALDADAIINLPKIKTHVQMGMSLGLKNLFGAVAGKRKAIAHFRNGPDALAFGRMLVAVTRRLRPALTIEDGIVVLERNGPTSGDPRAAGFLVASPDTTAADRVVLELLGVNPATVPYIAAAIEIGFGHADLSEIETVGEQLDALRVPDYVQVPAADRADINFPLGQVIRSILRQVVYLTKAKLDRS
jgi:uncharacterized protein (DUF362 family)